MEKILTKFYFESEIGFAIIFTGLMLKQNLICYFK